MAADQDTTPRGVAYCSWHKGLSDTARLIQTGSAGRLFACEKCRTRYRLAPIADQP